MMWPSFERRYNVWDPFREIRHLQNEVEKLFNRYEPARRGGERSFPAANIWSNDEKALVTVELPGIDPDRLDISVQDDQLTLRGSRDVLECAEGEVFHRRERGCGEFVRTIGLPFRVESEHVEAEYRRGVLRLLLPRAEHDKPKKIAVKAS